MPIGANYDRSRVQLRRRSDPSKQCGDAVTPVTTDELVDKAAGAKTASIVLAQATSDLKSRALAAIAKGIRARESEILSANAQDCANASARIEIDRLRLTADRVAGMARDVEAVSQLADPIGERFDRVTRPNGLAISK